METFVEGNAIDNDYLYEELDHILSLPCDPLPLHERLRKAYQVPSVIAREGLSDNNRRSSRRRSSRRSSSRKKI
jgi:hypothetical protein